MTEDLQVYDVVFRGRREPITECPRFGIVAQTTQPIEKVRHLAALIRQRFPDSAVEFKDTVCLPTKQRQHAAVELAQQCDVVVVIGGTHSNNTRELVATCRQYCLRVHHVQTASDLNRDWFLGAETAGLTAGTSTPDETINEVERWLEQVHSDFLPAANLVRLGESAMTVP